MLWAQEPWSELQGAQTGGINPCRDAGADRLILRRRKPEVVDDDHVRGVGSTERGDG